MKTRLTRRILTVALLVSAAMTPPSRALADFVFTVTQVGGNVVITGNGTLNLSALTPQSATSLLQPQLGPSFAYLASGSAAPGQNYGGVSGPANFGSGLAFQPILASGDVVGIYGIDHSLWVPFGYVFGTPLSNSSLYFNTTIAGLGLGLGSAQYVYTWGTGPTADSLTVIVVPEPSTVMLITWGCGGFLGLSWAYRRRCVRPAAVTIGSAEAQRNME